MLTTANGLIVIPFGLLVALAGELGSVFGSDDAQSVIKIVGIAGLAWCGVGTLLHLIRYCAALFAHPPRGAQQQADDAITERSWPRGSSDADFLVQTLVAVAVAIAVALKA